MATTESRPRRRIDWIAYLLLGPAVLLTLAFKAAPIVAGMLQSLTIRGQFAGLDNYARMVDDPVWWTAVANAIRGLLLLPIFIGFPLLVAFVLFQGVPGWQMFRAIFLFSYILPAVLVGAMWSVLLRLDGPLNRALDAIGLGAITTTWLGDSTTAIWTIFAISLWAWFGLGVLVYLAGLGAIPRDQFDAAAIDGASFRPLIRYIVIPSIVPTISYWAIVSTAGLLLWVFPFVYSTTQGGPGNASMVPEYYVYQVFSVGTQPEYAAALGIVLFLGVSFVSIFHVRAMYQRIRNP